MCAVNREWPITRICASCWNLTRSDDGRWHSDTDTLAVTRQLCPNSITFILLKTCWKPAGLRHVADKSETKNVGDLFQTKKSRRRACRCPNSIISILLKTCLKPGLRHVLSRSPTCRRQVRDLVSDKIDLMEFGHYRADRRAIQRLRLRVN